MSIRLGVNIDHVATVRNARGGSNPDVVRVAHEAVAGGADGITVHLREDRRHIRDADVAALMASLAVPLNLEMAATPEMQAFALALRPHAVCIVPERRNEVTTEGGLDAAANQAMLLSFIRPLSAVGIRVSLFIDARVNQVLAAHAVGARAVELHTGPFCEAPAGGKDFEFLKLKSAASAATSCAMECHAGHGLDYNTAAKVAAIPEVLELNIGHFLVGEAISVGISAAVARMRSALHQARLE